MKLKVERPLHKYESVVIMSPDCSEEDQKQFVRKNAEIVKTYGGTILSVDTWGKRRLANPISKYRVGQYFHSMFEAKAGCIAELERTMRINDHVLRFVHIRLDERKPLTKHLEEYRDTMALSREREQEREERAKAKKAAFAAARRPAPPRPQ